MYGSGKGGSQSTTPPLSRARAPHLLPWCNLFTMRPIDLCTAALVTTGNRALREPAKVRWEAVEELMGLSLRPKSTFDSRVTMVDAGGEHLSFEEWLENRPAPSARLWVSPFPEPGSSDPSLEALPSEVRDAIDSGGLGFLLYSDGQRIERFVPREVEPRLYDISGPQLLAFIQGRTHATALTEALARELDLQVEDLEGYLGTCSPDEMQDIVQRFMSVGSEVEYSSTGEEGPDDDAVERWNTFFTPAEMPSSSSFELLYAGPGSEDDLERELEACRSSLASALEAVQDFAQKQGLRTWARLFRRALLRLSLEPQPLEDLVELLQLNALPTPAIQLALCASAADVFGGMGSWNDMAFEGETGELYVSLSDRLLASSKTALRASLNRSAL